MSHRTTIVLLIAAVFIAAAIYYEHAKSSAVRSTVTANNSYAPLGGGSDYTAAEQSHYSQVDQRVADEIAAGDKQRAGYSAGPASPWITL